MKKWQVYIGGISLMLMLVACSQGSNSNWHNTEDEAIEFGLEEEGTDTSAILSTEKFKGETIVFYDHNGSFGVASITKNDKGYSWFRSEPYFGFDVSGDLPFTTAGFTYETEKGIEVPILYGKVLDPSVQKLKLTGDGNERELQLDENSPFFFAIHEEPYHSLKVTSEMD
ncbi:hypothetical protein VBD025_15055 [Virgibacillus flavescens]|uniref:hypothetical protein n=1 Tax=Virgibacillus flavescens TaxID=1611422 RepID=UPI003D357B23